jgi:hypothetical protein
VTRNAVFLHEGTGLRSRLRGNAEACHRRCE